MERTNEEIYDYISEYRDAHGWSPTVREACEAMGIRSTSSMSKRLHQMEQDGMLRFGGKARTYVPLPRECWKHADA